MKSKLKKIFGALVLLAVLVLTAPKPTTADVSQTTVDYLKAQTQSPWTTMALKAAGAANIATDHLKSVSGNTANAYAKTILALSALNLDPTTFGNIDYVAQLKSLQQNNQLGDPTLLNDDFWGLLALAAAGEARNSPAITDAKNFILAHQNSDGGFGWGVGQPSDTNDTAAAILALVESGENQAGAAVTAAVNYLQSVQSSDGGFSWDGAGESDANSSAWVILAIRKLGQQPDSWQKNGRTPVTFLESLKNQDGSYDWKSTDPGAITAATIDAAIALSEATMPIGYYQRQPAGSYHLRLEGQQAQICDAYITATNALDIVRNGAAVCGYTYVITDTDYGPYLQQINNEAAVGMSGWLGFLNYNSFGKSADQYLLQTGDEVLYYYGDWGWTPLRLILSADAVNNSEIITATVESYSGGAWHSVDQAIVRGGDHDYVTAASGQAELNLPDGFYNLYAVKAGHIRSAQYQVRVGDGVSQNLGLQVEVDQSTGPVSPGGGGQVGGDSISFGLNADQLNFGKLKPGQSATQSVTLANDGQSNLQISAQVTGDNLFVNNIKLNSQPWGLYRLNLNTGASADAAVSLSIPSTYLDSGIKTGELIFWAIAR